MGGRRWVLFSFFFAFVGCAGAAGPRAATEPSETAEAPEPAPEQTATPEADPAPVPTATLPDPLPEIGTLPTASREDRGPYDIARVHYDLVRHPDEGVRAQLSALVTSIAQEIARRGDGGCRVRLAHPRLVVLRCEVLTLDRGAYDTEAFALALAIHEGGLRPVHHSELVRRDLMEQLRERCLERARRIDAAHEYAMWLYRYAGYVDPCGHVQVWLDFPVDPSTQLEVVSIQATNEQQLRRNSGVQPFGFEKHRETALECLRHDARCPVWDP